MTIPTIKEDEKQLVCSYTASGNINWYNHLAKLYGSIYHSYIWYNIYHTICIHTQCLSNSNPSYIPKKCMHTCTKRYIQECSWQHYF